MRLNMDMLTAVERVDESIGLASAEVADGTERVPSAADNDRALAALAGMMGGVK